MANMSDTNKVKYCNYFKFDLSLFTKDTLDAMEEDMKNSVKVKVTAKHNYNIRQEGERWRTEIKLTNGKRKTLRADNLDDLYQILYDHYYGNSNITLKTLFTKTINKELERKAKSNKTILEYTKTFKQFFEGEDIISIPIHNISIKDWMFFLDKAHSKIGKKDILRGKNIIEKHRHDDIHRIITMIYHYANAYEDLGIISPFVSIDYTQFPYYTNADSDADWYTPDEIRTLKATFDGLKAYTMPILAVGAILETGSRNGEIRALRFEDFHLDEGYVRICGLANQSIREERVKADSEMGMRNISLTDRMRFIYHESKKISWSETYPFVRERQYVDGEQVLVTMQAVQRALKKLCTLSGIRYLPPHQLRFANATLMAQQGRRVEDIQRYLGHTTSTMSQHYIRNYQKSIPISGPAI